MHGVEPVEPLPAPAAESAEQSNWGKTILSTGLAPDADKHPITPASVGDAEPDADGPLDRRRRRVRAVIDPAVGRGLEIGPLCSPLVTKDQGDVHYVDVLSTDGLREHYAADPGVVKEEIVDVDVALYADGRMRPIAEATAEVGPFDWAVASHVIEHVPDMVGWLADMADALVDDGRLVLVIPDRRYSFDARRPRTTVGQLLQAYEQRDQRPSVRAVYDHLSDVVSITAEEAWTGRVPGAHDRVHDRALVAEVLQKYRDSPDYIDCHVWLFTPQEFVEQLAELAEHGLLQFVVEHVVPTAPFDLEFFVTLRRIPRGASPAEKAALLEHGFTCPADVRLPGEGSPEEHRPQQLPDGVCLRTLSSREARLLDAKRRAIEAARGFVAGRRRAVARLRS